MRIDTYRRQLLPCNSGFSVQPTLRFHHGDVLFVLVVEIRGDRSIPSIFAMARVLRERIPDGR